MRARRWATPTFGKWFVQAREPGYRRPPIEECLQFDFAVQLRRMRI